MIPSHSLFRPLSRTVAWAGVALAAALVLAGCQTLRDLSPRARKEAETATRLQQLQARNMRFSDEYVGRLMEAVHDAEPRLEDPGQRYMLSGWMLSQANAAYTYASGENALIACLDLVTLATLSRIVIEDNAQQRFPSQATELIDTHRDLEAAAWDLADDLLTPAQEAEMRRLIQDWRARHPDVDNAPFVRFQEFVALAPAQPAQERSHVPTSLMGLVGLDPMAGLDPAVRQVEQSRLLGERAIFYAQRVPIIFDLQLDRSLNRMAAGPEARRLLAQTASLTTSTARFAAVAEALPGTIAAEREALIRQVADTLNAQEATLGPMLVELRQALEAGQLTATSVEQAVRSIDALRAQFARKPGEPPGKEFDIDDYARAATEITRAAGELRLLLGSVGTQAPQVGTALHATVAQGRSLVDYLFVRVAWLIALLCVGLLATLLLYRWLAPRIRPS